MAYIYSTTTQSVNFDGVIIEGIIPNAHRNKITTVNGAPTQVDQHTLDILKQDVFFQSFVKDGYYLVQDDELTTTQTEKLVKEYMRDGDNARQETPESIKKARK